MQPNNLIKSIPIFLGLLSCFQANSLYAQSTTKLAESPAKVVNRTVKVTYSEARGIGPEKNVMRRDPSDIIKIDGLYYVWYSKGEQSSGYDATIWYATSPDGHVWTEKKESIARGPIGSWDEQSVFTPNILIADDRYWLFYTAVPKPFSNGNKGEGITKTAIGVAVSESPNGPWKKSANNPVLLTSDDHKKADSLRIDDTCLVIRDGRFWCYYKGRPWAQSARQTKMCLAIADQPEGPYLKHPGNPIILGNHEVQVWSEGKGVAAMIGTVGPKSITSSIMHSDDGLRFNKTHSVENVPTASGAYRPSAFSASANGSEKRIDWGVHIGTQKGYLPFIERYDLEWPTE